MSPLRRLSVSVALVALSVIGRAQAQSEVQKTWEQSVVYVDGVPLNGGVAALPAKPGPVVIYMHGCPGIGGPEGDTRRWAALISKSGYTFIMPDSYARTDRKSNCDGKAPATHALRLEEISFAVDQLKKQPWFDGKAVFLMGHSEGGIAAVRSREAGFKGVVASGWTCTNAKDPEFDGVVTPREIPLLTLMRVDDPTYKAEHLKGTCASKISDRANAAHVAVPGTGHGIFDSDIARNAVLSFFKQHGGAS